MTAFSDWHTMPDSIKAHLDAIEDFVGDVDGRTTADDATIDAEDAVKAVNGLIAEVERLRAALKDCIDVMKNHDAGRCTAIAWRGAIEDGKAALGPVGQAEQERPK